MHDVLGCAEERYKESPELRSMEPSLSVEEEEARRYEEDRRRLLDIPWGLRLDSPTPDAERERSAAKPKLTSPLDLLLFPAWHMEGAFLPTTFATLGSSTRTVSASNEKEYPVLDDLLRGLWVDQEAAPQRLSQLENFAITRSNTRQLLLRGWQLTSSLLPNTRAAGYSLLELICKHHQPLSVTQRHYVWISILSFGSEKEEVLRRLQMKALSTLIGPHGDIVGMNDALTQILNWIGETASRTGRNDLNTLTECHGIVKCIITHDIDPLEERQVDEIVRTYCNLVTQSVESSERNTTVCSRDVTTTLAVSMLVQIIDLIWDQDLIPDLVINTLVQTLCLVLGCGGESRPSAFGNLSSGTEYDSSEAYQYAAQTALRLLNDRMYRLPVLESLEDILRHARDHSLSVGIGAVNAVCERVWSGLTSFFENGSRDGVRGEREDLLISFDDEITILQEIPQEWINSPAAGPLFTRVIKIVGQFVHSFDFETSPSVRHFMNVTISRIAILLERFNHPDGSPSLLVISQQPDHTRTLHSPLLNEIETLLVRIFQAPRIPPNLVYVILTMFRHLHDQDLLAAIVASQKQLSPVHVDWAQYFSLHLEIYREKAGKSLSCRRMILSSIEKIHGQIVDVAVFHDEIREPLVLSLGKTLQEEHDEEILHSVFRILSQELIATISGDDSEQQRTSCLNQICEGWIELARGECKCRPRNQMDMTLGSPPKSSDCWRHTLAVNFLINAFNKTVFTNTGDGPSDPTELTSQSSLGASTFYLYLFDKLLALIRPQSRRMDKHYVFCVKARLTILQWMLRIRADSKHRVFILVGDLPEAISLAQMAQRADTSAAPFWMHNDVDSDMASRIKSRRQSTGPSNWPSNSGPISGSGTPRLRRRSLRSAGDILNLSIPESSMEGKEGKERVADPSSQFYWYLPDVLMVDITEEMKRPSRAILTPTGNEECDQCVTLPIHLYLSTITEIITYSRDWEVVSYILCHLPIQLSNKRAFYGPETNKTMRQLVVAICASINGNRLYNRMRYITPPELPESAVQAILYQSLTVLLGYHNWLEPLKREWDDGMNLNSLIVDSLVEGLSGGVRARRPCLEALSIAVYRVPEEIAKRNALIVEKFTSFATNPFNSLQILEYLIIVGYTPNLHVGIFQDVDYYRVFGLALMYIQHYIRPDAETITTPDGKESYALAQHVYRTSFTIFYVWVLSMKLPERVKFVPFIVKGLHDATDKGKKIDPAIEICLDWLLQNTYGNVDPVPWSWFMYTSVAFPGYGSRTIPTDWIRKKEAQMENVADIKAWKLGNAIMVVSIMKQPVDWASVVIHRPAGRMELYCRVENVHRSTPVDGFESYSDSNGVDTEPDAGGKESQDYEAAIRSVLFPLIFNGEEPWDASKLRAYPDVKQLWPALNCLRHTPVVDPHRVGVLYVAPGQTREEDILSNTHGSLTYAHFLSHLAQVVDLSSLSKKVFAKDLKTKYHAKYTTAWMDEFARGLQAKLHGKYTLAWMDDIAAINFHVATMMPNIGDNTSKKAPIGNDAVKIVWNDGGHPYDFTTFRSAFNLINIVIEPQSPASTAAYQTSLDGFLKITLQVAPGLPRLTPIGDFKIVRLEYLPAMIRHFTLLAVLFCEVWMGTGCDGPEVGRTRLQTNWKARLACIERTEKFLEPQIAQTGQ